MARSETAPQFVLRVVWYEPEEGSVTFGPFDTAAEAEAAWPEHAGEFMNDGELPDDVDYSVEVLS